MEQRQAVESQQNSIFKLESRFASGARDSSDVTSQDDASDQLRAVSSANELPAASHANRSEAGRSPRSKIERSKHKTFGRTPACQFFFILFFRINFSLWLCVFYFATVGFSSLQIARLHLEILSIRSSWLDYLLGM